MQICFSLGAFKIIFLSLTFIILIMTQVSVVLFGSVLLGTLYFLDLDICFLPQLKDMKTLPV